MDKNDNLNTHTRAMAEMYVAQGYYVKAIDIYRHLLQTAPQAEDLLQALSAVEAKQRETAAPANAAQSQRFEGTLEATLEQWVRLMLFKKNVTRLERLKAGRIKAE